MTLGDSYVTNDIPCQKEATKHIKEILDAQNKPAILDEIAATLT